MIFNTKTVTRTIRKFILLFSWGKYDSTRVPKIIIEEIGIINGDKMVVKYNIKLISKNLIEKAI